MRVLLSAIMPLAALLKGGDAIKAAALPAVSAVADTLPGFNATSWFGLLPPAERLSRSRTSG